MTNYCNEGGKVHMWCYPDFDVSKVMFRICMFCKVSQTRVWKNDYLNGEHEDDTGFEKLINKSGEKLS